MARAKELLDLIKSPTALATGVLVAFAQTQLNRNDAKTKDIPMTRWALLAAVLATAIAAAVVGVMTPLAYRTIITNRGYDVETRLLVYNLTFLVAIATTLYALRCALLSAYHLWPSGRWLKRIFDG